MSLRLQSSSLPMQLIVFAETKLFTLLNTSICSKLSIIKLLL